MQNERKFRLPSREYLEGRLATYFRKAENRAMLLKGSRGSLIIDLEKDGPWLQGLLDMNETQFRALSGVMYSFSTAACFSEQRRCACKHVIYCCSENATPNAAK